MDLPRRRFLLGSAAALALVATNAACRNDSNAGASAGATEGGAEDGALPATITHKFGETTVTEYPKRVAVVGLVEQDALLALGIDPVLTSEWFGDAPGYIFPWAQEALGDGPIPETRPSADSIQIETVAAAAPDLIIGIYSGMKKNEYELLSKIAPTICQPADYVDYGTPWDETTLMVGTAIGKPAAARQLVDKVNGDIAAARDAHPEFGGRQAVVATPYEGIWIYGPEDPRTRMLTALGFTFPAALTDASGDEFGGSISPEQTGKLDVDVAVWLGTKEQVNDGTGGLWPKTSAAKQGRDIFINESDGDYYIASTWCARSR